MKIYDISQEVFNCEVYPGDPAPKKEILSSMNNGDVYNLTAFFMCAHNGTHIDSPYHFFERGKSIDQIPLEKVVGACLVVEHDGVLSENNASEIIKKAQKKELTKILIKGNATVSLEAASVFKAAGIDLLGNESQTVGPEDAPMSVHKELLGADVVLLEGIRLRPLQSFFN